MRGNVLVVLRRISKAFSWIIAIRESPITPIFLLSGMLMLFVWLERMALFLMVGAVLVVAKYFYVFLRPDNRNSYPLLSRLSFPIHGTHRGGADQFGPENTLYNFRRCVSELNTDILEIDLRMSSDGHIVLMHDITLNRTTNGTGAVSNFTLAQLKELDAAWHYPGLRSTGIQIPTLQEVLEEFNTTDVIFFF